jgi:hypothetical protein
MLARSRQLVDKAKSALVSAIEVYNKPDFAYREETFSILALNAWELLLKAKIVADADNDPRSVYVREKRRTKSGEWSKKKYFKRNRAGNPHTIGLSELVATLDKDSARRLSPAVKSNLYALIEVRDNAVHYMIAGPGLSKRVLEIGMASVRNFIDLAQRWFSMDLSEYSLYLMPIGFIPVVGAVDGVSPSGDEARLLKYLESLIGSNDDERSMGYSVALEVDISMKRSSSDASLAVTVTDDPNAPRVHLTEEDIRQKYPWDYAELSRRLRERYVDFKMNRKYHSIRMPLRADPRYVKTRLLDPGNPKSSKKDFYSPNILTFFDRHYTRK